MENEEFQKLVLAKLGELDSIKSKLGELDNIKGTQELLVDQFAKMFGEFQGLKGEIKGVKDSLESRIDRLDDKVSKHGILMEKINMNIKIVAEGISAHREQNNFDFASLEELVKEKNNLLESVITRNSRKLQLIE